MQYTMSLAPRVPVGSVVAMYPFGIPLVQHVGIVAGYDHGGMPLVTHNSVRRGGTYTETLAQFAAGQPVRILARQSSLPVHETLRRVSEKGGNRWNLFAWNCEHFVNYALGVDVGSVQLQRATVLGVLCAMLSLAD